MFVLVEKFGVPDTVFCSTAHVLDPTRAVLDPLVSGPLGLIPAVLGLAENILGLLVLCFVLRRLAGPVIDLLLAPFGKEAVDASLFVVANTSHRLVLPVFDCVIQWTSYVSLLLDCAMVQGDYVYGHLLVDEMFGRTGFVFGTVGDMIPVEVAVLGLVCSVFRVAYCAFGQAGFRFDTTMVVLDRIGHMFGGFEPVTCMEFAPS